MVMSFRPSFRAGNREQVIGDRPRFSDARRVFVDSDCTSGSIQPTRCARG